MKQLTLWQEQPQPLAHHHIEVIWLSGHREIICTASSRKVERPGDYEWGTGFVGGATTLEECSICNPKSEREEQERSQVLRSF